jgi:hypothetical protein
VEVSAELVWLIERLRTTSSRRAQLRLLLEAWSTVRDLSAADRLLVARELGFDGAERLVEHIAQGHGGLSTMLGAAVDRLEQETGSGVGDLMRDLLDPTARREVVEHVVDAADAWAAEVHSSREPGSSGAESPGGLSAAERVEAAAATLAEPQPGEAPSTEAGEPAAVVAAPPSEQRVPLSPGDAESLRVEDHPSPAVHEPVSTDRAALRQPASDGLSAELQPQDRGRETATARVAGAGTPDAGDGSSAAEGLACRLEAEPRITERLRRLGRHLGVLRDAGVEEISAVIGTFPPGWARRRALQRVLEAGVPRQIADAVRLLGMLERPSERLWAITTIAATRRLDEAAREMLLAAVESPAVRQRLARRFGRR